MVNIGEAGRICLNQERQGACENCLWWEWDAARGECGNCHYHVCPLYRERLFSQGVQDRARRETLLRGTGSGARQSSSTALADLLDAKAEEPGIS